jgi:alkanesulfonate monooxygenase SsuD/methylene tetrahydromethanopterin reductase-like flavin-dependent oxidoreductase (luciferase family)
VTSFAVGLPNRREYADPRVIAELAGLAELRGWDGVFVWDHLVDVEPSEDGGLPVTDPWIALAAAAAVTERVRLGPMVTPLARRRPWKVARETVALDLLSNGRLVFGVGLGAHADEEFAAFGDPADARVRADLLDEGLDIIESLWSGRPVAHDGERYQVSTPGFRPGPVQRPRIPIWIAGTWPNRRPFRRAARYDAVFPTRVGVGHAEMMPPGDLADIVAYVSAHRAPDAGAFDVAMEGQTSGVDTAADAQVVGAYVAAGLTWWVEKLGWFRGDIETVRARIDAGPPRAH